MKIWFIIQLIPTIWFIKKGATTRALTSASARVIRYMHYFEGEITSVLPYIGIISSCKYGIHPRDLIFTDTRIPPKQNAFEKRRRTFCIEYEHFGTYLEKFWGFDSKFDQSKHTKTPPPPKKKKKGDHVFYP